MAEELENTRKPKAELIKHTVSAKAAEVEAPKATEAERRKVVVVKKKSPAAVNKPSQAQAAVNAAQSMAAPKTSRTASPKVVSVHSQEQHPKQSQEKTGHEQDGKKEEKPPVQEFVLHQRPIGAAGRVGGRPVRQSAAHQGAGSGQGVTRAQSGAQGKEDASAGGASTGRQGFPFAQRPVGVAGRVGGRYVRQDGAGRTGGGAERSGGRPPFNRTARPGTAGQSGPFPSRSGGRPGGAKPGFGGETPPVPDGKAKKSFKAKKTVYQKKEQEMEEKLLQTKKKITQVANPVPKSIDIMEVVSVSELARKMNLKASDLIQKLMNMGMMVTINQQIDAETATLLAAEFGADVKIVSLYDETLIDTGADDISTMERRPPVVTVMGHVDHGKTKLLDAIRSADVASGEFGGITQHIGAYMVETPQGRITFLDTPGHEAFTRMRARGAQVTDIVILVVAADDGVMPQTVEAINHAREADVPIIVAVNKIDKPEANPDKVKSQLSDLALMPEDWGGQTMFVELSALKKEGIDKLIDAILLEAEILDLKANYNRTAEGKVLESRIDQGRGVVATVIIEKGTLKVGDSFVAGVWPGKVRALFNDKGEKIDAVSPSMPAEVLGFEGIPNAGDPLQVVDDERSARGVSGKRQELKRFEDAKNIRKITLDNLHQTISDGAIQELKVIIKSDVQGSAEALRSSLEKLSNKEVRVHVIQALPGAINEGDVDLAAASNAIILGFNVRPTPKAKALADQERVDVRKYNIIYKAVEEIQQALEGMLKPDIKEEVIASVEIRNTFKVPKVGTIAGCYVLTGTVKRSASANLIRDGIVVHTGKIASLKRFKDDAREVAAGFECGLGIEDFDDVQVGDQLEVFEIIQVARKLSGST
ncbi:MAG: translation initiation factor IF-2 [Spirochaetaceae bacterium]|jgi:translation initiation factor IF-2|nr:translation initiation factor IF-2 [Spirochaetaceae bacterium]